MDVSYDVSGFVDTDADRGGGRFEGWSLEYLESEICSTAANMTAAEARWFALIAEFDRRQGWVTFGSTSCATWLQHHVGMDRATAHEKVRVAHALERFPAFAIAMSAGVLSYAKARAITRVATLDNADMLLDIALQRSSHQVERYVAALRRCEATADDLELRAFTERSLTYRTEDASMVITIRVPVESGAAFVASLNRFTDNHDLDVPLTARRSDAAVVMAEHAVATLDQPTTTNSRYLVTLHLTPDVFDNDTATNDAAVRACDVPDEDRNHPSGDRERLNVCCVAPGDGLAGHPSAVSPKTARRILCDAVLQGYAADRPDASALGADHRCVSLKLKRALRLRDHGCVAPGCDRMGWLDAHHIVHWINDGPTVASNLVCLCRFHHRLMHEGGWWITGDPNTPGALQFHRPDGTTLPTGQPLTIGHADIVDDIGCTDEALQPTTTVEDQLDAIATVRHARRRARTLRPVDRRYQSSQEDSSHHDRTGGRSALNRTHRIR